MRRRRSIRRCVRPASHRRATWSGSISRRYCLRRPVVPRETRTSLPHQVEGIEFLRRNERAALFDEQGLGKSKQLIDAVAAQIVAGDLAGAVIVCPNGLKTNWAEEIAKFSHLPFAVVVPCRTA